MSTIEINNLCKSYNGSEDLVLKNLNLTINKGERYGLFGSNGAGKTTLISIISGTLKYTSGSVKVFDTDLKTNWSEIKHKIGIVPQENAFYEQLSAIENLSFFGKMYQLPKADLKNRIDELISDFGMESYAKKRSVSYSGGMKRKLNLALGVLHRPELLILDEPTVGVDVKSKATINKYLLDLNQKEQTTFFYTSHMMDEAQSLCSHIGILIDGTISEKAKTADFLSKYKTTNMEDIMMEILD
jgi:ABC-2 type transport system ATP-binding protein